MKVKGNRGGKLMQRAITNEDMRICPMCCKNIEKENLVTTSIDGLWLCSDSCIAKFLKEKKNWSPNAWNALCNMQILYECKRAEISTEKNSVK